MERAVAIRRQQSFPRFQSAYRRRHSPETAMLRVWSDILTAADQRHVTLLGLLGVPRRQPHRRSGLANLPSVGAVP